ncbi:MAG TPA: hypothetical protein VF126_11605 [Acidobacteriaceae bacterium]
MKGGQATAERLIVGDFATVWQPVAPWVPGRTALAYSRSLHFAMAQRAIGSGREADHMRR